MVLLLNPMSGTADAWRAAMNTVPPEVEVRIWPDVESLPTSSSPSSARCCWASSPAAAPAPHRVDAGRRRPSGDQHRPARRHSMVRTGLLEGDPMMTEFVLLHVLRHHRRLPEYPGAAAPRMAGLPQPRTEERRVGFMDWVACPAGGPGREGTGLPGRCLEPPAQERRRHRDLHGRAELPAFPGAHRHPAQPAAADLLRRRRRSSTLRRWRCCRRVPPSSTTAALHVVEADLIAALDAGHLGRHPRRLPGRAPAGRRPALAASAHHRHAARRPAAEADRRRRRSPTTSGCRQGSR